MQGRYVPRPRMPPQQTEMQGRYGEVWGDAGEVCTQAEDAAAADGDARLAHVGDGLQPVVVRARRDHLRVARARVRVRLRVRVRRVRGHHLGVVRVRVRLRVGVRRARGGDLGVVLARGVEVVVVRVEARLLELHGLLLAQHAERAAHLEVELLDVAHLQMWADVGRCGQVWAGMGRGRAS